MCPVKKLHNKPSMTSQLKPCGTYTTTVVLIKQVGGSNTV